MANKEEVIAHFCQQPHMLSHNTYLGKGLVLGSSISNVQTLRVPDGAETSEVKSYSTSLSCY